MRKITFIVIQTEDEEMTKYVLVRTEPGKPAVKVSFDTMTDAILEQFRQEGIYPNAKFKVEVRA